MILYIPILCYQIFVEFSLMMLVDRPRPRQPRSLFLSETVLCLFADDVDDLKNCLYSPINVVSAVKYVIIVREIPTVRTEVIHTGQAYVEIEKIRKNL